MLPRQELLEQGAELSLAEHPADLHVSERLLEPAHILGQVLHLGKSLLDLEELLGHDFETLGKAGIEGLLQLLVDGEAHLLELLLVLILDFLEPLPDGLGHLRADLVQRGGLLFGRLGGGLLDPFQPRLECGHELHPVLQEHVRDPVGVARERLAVFVQALLNRFLELLLVFGAAAPEPIHALAELLARERQIVLHLLAYPVSFQPQGIGLVLLAPRDEAPEQVGGGLSALSLQGEQHEDDQGEDRDDADGRNDEKGRFHYASDTKDFKPSRN